MQPTLLTCSICGTTFEFRLRTRAERRRVYFRQLRKRAMWMMIGAVASGFGANWALVASHPLWVKIPGWILWLPGLLVALWSTVMVVFNWADNYSLRLTPDQELPAFSQNTTIKHRASYR